ncbi:CAP domain [Trinorchestia longiramus]|nr:CAP domain [Trinorchestia longiramus]
MVKLFKNVSHEENFPAVQNVDRNMEKDLPSSLSKKMGSLKFLRRRLISHKNQSQAVYWVRVSHGKYQQQYSYGVAMKRRKTTSLGRKTPPRIQLSRNELRISDASRKSPWIRRTRKQVLSYLVHFKCNSEGSRPLVCRVYITLFISRHFLGSRVIVVIRMGCQPVSLGVRHIRSQPVRFDILRIRRHADRFSIQRTGFQPHNLNVRNIGCQQISHGTRYSRQQPVCLGVRSTACQACLQCIPVGNRGTGKHSAGCRLHCVRREKTWSRMQLPTSCIANNNGLIDSPINVSGTNNNRLGPLRTDDEYDYTYLSDDKESRHSKPEKQRTRDTGRETKTFLGSKLTPTRPGNVGLASGWWSNIRMLTLLLVCLLTGVVKSCPYAAVDPRHTICVFMPKQCPGKMLIRTGELTCHDKERILTKHNMLRQEAALGQVRGQPAAINMKTMVWDDELAMVAQRWADQCMPGHDRSRNVLQLTKYNSYLCPSKLFTTDNGKVTVTAAVLQLGKPSVGHISRWSRQLKLSVGASVQASVGVSFGALVEASIGASVGASVGTSVRASVGASVGASVEASVRASVEASVRASVGA